MVLDSRHLCFDELADAVGQRGRPAQHFDAEGSPGFR
jgi:hypothetical protein